MLFYVGWEIMMIPLYVLMGVWGGEGRRGRDDPVRRLHARRVAAHAGRDRRRSASSAGTFELPALVAQPHESTWLFLAFAAAFCIKAPLFPLHGWLPSAYRESSPEVAALLSGVVSKAGAYGLLRFAVPLFPQTRPRLALAAPRARAWPASCTARWSRSASPTRAASSPTRASRR